MGNEAIGLGAIDAGVSLVSGYPGTPSTEILESVAKFNDGSIHVQWSTNEKAALEVAAGAAYCGARTLVTMKQVGLNVASDPLMSLAYVGVKGGMVVVSADDPGPISSQTEQDTRTFARFAKIPVFDPSNPEEAYEMIQDAFELSERIGSPVLFRPVTRVAHSCAQVEVCDSPREKNKAEFVKDTMRWVIFPRTSFENHKKIEARNVQLSDELSSYRFNKIEGGGKVGIATGSVSYGYVKDALGGTDAKIFKVSTPFPFPEKLALEFLQGLKKVIVIEELDPVIERELTYICGKHGIKMEILGKLSGHVQSAGENSTASVKKVLSQFFDLPQSECCCDELPALPVRPPVLCAGCPHRASFYAVKKAMRGKKAVFSGDIGCYTLGNAKPLDMVDTCLCMGADITIAQGIHIMEPDTVNFSFIGDSTFFASGMTGVVNAVYNNTNIVIIVLDNSTTAMTGHQPHPGTGVTMMGDITEKVSIERVLEAIGVKSIQTVDPLKLDEAVQAVKTAAGYDGVSAVIFKSPCIAVSKPTGLYRIDKDLCQECTVCVRELGCPAITAGDGSVCIDSTLCFGCGVCSYVCPFDAIKKEEK